MMHTVAMEFGIGGRYPALHQLFQGKSKTIQLYSLFDALLFVVDREGEAHNKYIGNR
jgi:hypothetical protein